MLRASCLTLEINEFKCYEAKIEESEKPVLPVVKPRTPGSSRQCSATEPQQPDNHQPPQSSICTAQVVLNASVAHLAATQHVPSKLHLGLTGKVSPSGKNPCWVVYLFQNAQSILSHAGNERMKWHWGFIRILSIRVLPDGGNFLFRFICHL